MLVKLLISKPTFPLLLSLLDMRHECWMETVPPQVILGQTGSNLDAVTLLILHPYQSI